MVQIERLDTSRAVAELGQLVKLLQDAVDSGASIGFLPPLSGAEAERYWHGVIAALRDGSRVLVVAHQDTEIVGAAQLDLCTRANGRHRAEVTKLMVHSSKRRQGIGRALMLVIAGAARNLDRTTLVLDTRKGDPSEALYASLGWVKAGEIPRYASGADGELHTTAFYFKLLDSHA